MTINWLLWKKPEVGGVLFALLLTLSISVFVLAQITSHYNQTQNEIKTTNLNLELIEKHLKYIEDYEKLTQQEAQKFATFKRKKWSTPLSQSRLNQSLYTLQKQANVEFLVIQPQPLADPANITKLGMSLKLQVLRDQSFFSFLQKLETALPGIIKIKSFELKRINELSAQLAQKVSEGEKVSLFEGIIELDLEYEQFVEKNNSNSQ